jgi:predicted RND superfamily exporter protein
MAAFDAFFTRLAALQVRRAGTIVLLSFAVALAALPLILKLKLDTTFEALLPTDKPSVRDLELIRGRTGGLSTLTLAIESEAKNVPAMQQFAATLVPKLQELDNEGVRSVEWNVAEYEDFVKQHKGLYAGQKDLEEIRDSLQERIEFEKSKANPLFFDLSDEEPPSADELISRLKKKSEQGLDKAERFPGGYYVHAERNLLAVFIRTEIRGGDAEKSAQLIGAVQRTIDATDPKHFGPDLRVEFAGDILHAREEHDEIAKELGMSAGLTLFLVLGAIIAFFRRVSVVPLLGMGIAVPVLINFGCARLLVGQLNTSTSFLASIVLGNGINPFIMWLSRYFEERAQGNQGSNAILATHQGTWTGTFAASAAAGISYASLILTDFRGFRDFGIIGSLGMAWCWLFSIVLLPALISLWERFVPFDFSKEANRSTVYNAVFAKPVFAFPRGILLGSTALLLSALTLTTLFVLKDPIEYDFRNLKSVRESSSRASSINGRVASIVGGSGAGQGIAIVLPTVEEAAHTKAELLAKIEQGKAEYSRVRSLDDLLPAEQAQKVPLLHEIRELLLEARRFAKPDQQAKIDENIPPAEVKTLTYADLPASVARPFTERDGTRGRILFVEQKKDVSLWDGRYLVHWAKDLRTLRMQNGERPPLAGQAPVFADMIEVVWADGPKAVLLSLCSTTLLVIFAFRRMYERILALSALLSGIALMAGTMALLHIKLNFLNFVAFPIAFGIGVDYSVNVLKRYIWELEHGTEREESVRLAIAETGGAVALCSLTTIIGYSSLYVSANRALNTFGASATISEITNLITAGVTMPALMLYLSRRKQNRQQNGASS